MPPHRAFTTRYLGRTRVLVTKIKICEPSAQEDINSGKADLREYVAIWDTGATNSAITKKVVNDLTLKPSGVAEVRHAKGKSSTNTYFVDIALPSQVMFGQMRVTEAELISDGGVPEEEQPQVLIGMDIIGAGDFAVTNFNGRTMLSFSLPSSREIDFIPEADRKNLGGTRAERRANERELKKKGLL